MKRKLWVLGLLQKMCFDGCCFDFLFFFFSATLDICLASHAINWDSLKVLFLLHSSATFVVNQYCLGFTSELCKHAWQKKKSERVIEAKFVLTLSCCSYKLAREQTLWQFHQKLGEFNYGWPTLQMNLVFRALNQNGADRIEVVIVTASERACPCFGHLRGEKQACNNNPYREGNQLMTLSIPRERNRERDKGKKKMKR